MYRVVAVVSNGRTKKSAQLDALMDAVFYALTWSLLENADVAVLDGSVVVCTAADGGLSVNGASVDVHAVIARAARIRLAA